MKVIIAGGRDYADYNRLKKILDKLIYGSPDLQIVQGGAKGADSLAAKYAEEYAIDLATFEADWDTNGKSAGAMRNAEMGKYGHALIAFWDMKSPGTKNMIEVARNHKLPVIIIVY